MKVVLIYQVDRDGVIRKSFDSKPGKTWVYGAVLVPSGSRWAGGACGRLLSVPVSRGSIRLSAKDVAEQAFVGGCGMRWIHRP